MRPLPEVTADTEFFWTSGRDGRLRILRCDECGFYVHPVAPRCPVCFGTVQPAVVSGRATLFSFTINYQPWMPGAEVPYAIALVELAEQQGLRLTTNLVACPIRDIKIGMPLEVCFEEHDGVWLPLFRRAQG